MKKHKSHKAIEMCVLAKVGLKRVALFVVEQESYAMFHVGKDAKGKGYVLFRIEPPLPLKRLC